MIALRLFRIAIAVLLVSCAGAAGAPQVAPPPAPCALPIRVSLQASERLNPNEHGESLPTSVRVYQLKQAARMEASAFSEVWRAPSAVLVDDLLAVQVVTLFPGQAAELEVALAPDTRFLSGVAIFRQPSGTQWRSILPMPLSPGWCADYAARGSPSPAVTFRFQDYSVESDSRLLSEAGPHTLPVDVAPLPTDSTKGAR